MDMRIEKNIRENAVLRESFFKLAREIFGLSFEAWYKNGYWQDRYIPYALVEKERVVSNASVNIIDTSWRGEKRRYIQIGTVMTAPDYRKRGCSRRLMEEILADWKEKADAIYLYANDTVLDFYPKFGFVPENEYVCEIPVAGIYPDECGTGAKAAAHERLNAGENTPDECGAEAAAGEWLAAGEKISEEAVRGFVKLDMDVESHRRLLARCYMESNPYSELPMLNNYGLLMFYCGDFMKDCVYYSPYRDVVCVAQQEGEVLYCMDIFGSGKAALETVLSELAEGRPMKSIILGFTPKGVQNGIFRPLDAEDTTLFVLRDRENIFSKELVRMPELSHA